MTRWLLNTFPTWALGLLIVGGFVALALLLLWLMQKRIPKLVSSEQGVAGANACVIVIGMYGILLAFVILVLFEGFSGAKANAEHEASALAEVRRDTHSLPVAAEVDAKLHDYIGLVVDSEWELMATDGRGSEEAWAAIDGIYEPFRSYEPKTESQVVFYSEAVNQINQVVEARRTRLTDASESLPGEFLVLVFGGAVLVIAFLCLAGSSNRTAHALFVAGVAALLGFNVLLIVILDHPFSGAVGVGPEVFTEGVLAGLR